MLFCLSILAPVSRAFAARTFTVDLDDDRSRWTFQMNLIRRLPRLHALNDNFERSLDGLFAATRDIAEYLDLARRDFVLKPMPVTGLTYTDDGESLGYDEAGLAAIRAQLIVRAQTLFDSIARAKTPLHPTQLATERYGETLEKLQYR